MLPINFNHRFNRIDEPGYSKLLTLSRILISEGTAQRRRAELTRTVNNRRDAHVHTLTRLSQMIDQRRHPQAIWTGCYPKAT